MDRYVIAAPMWNLVLCQTGLLNFAEPILSGFKEQGARRTLCGT
jgi:FMN-dependent NADH-azoreductase